MTTDRRIPVVEIFGPTMQGEGAMAGTSSHFIRFGGCDFACSWCDSAHAVLAEEVRKAEKLTTDQISTRVSHLPEGPRWVTYSGGNPVLHELDELTRQLHEFYGFQIAVETQGTIYKPWLRRVDLLTVSPKPPSSGNMVDDRHVLGFIADAEGMDINLKRAKKSQLKVVVFDDRDYEYAKELHSFIPNVPFFLSVGTQMGGLRGDFAGGHVDSSEDVLTRYRWLAEKATHDPSMADVKIFPQLHYLVWGNVHGR